MSLAEDGGSQVSSSINTGVFMSRQKSITWLSLIGSVSLSFLAACNTATTTSSDTSTDTVATATTAFPSSLTVSSPLSYEEAASASVSSSLIKAVTSGSAYASSFALSTAEIEAILTASSSTACTFDPSDFLSVSNDAGCYGPTLQYEDHPDSGGIADGQLPSGDVGIWSENDATTGNACAAAELNAQMEGVSLKTNAALKALASMICVVNTNGLTMPSESTLDITTEMNALGVTDTTFSGVSLTHAINADGNDQYSYTVDFTYTPGASPYDVSVAMDHIPGASTDEYNGRLNYAVNSYFTGGNCPGNDVTINGSVLYASASSAELALQAREGTFCGHDADGLTDGIVDPSLKYNSSTAPNGWTDDFNIFTAEMDPSTMEGNYTYAWQAGFGDGNTRTFNVTVNSSAEGVAFYGYGDDVEDTDGSIGGFICNWAGPSNSHTLQDYAQYQAMSLNTTTGLIESDSVNIGYAPTNSCDYDGTGSFTLDTDFDGLVDSDPAVVIANDLLALTDGDSDGVFDEIDASAFVLPVAPDNL